MSIKIIITAGVLMTVLLAVFTEAAAQDSGAFEEGMKLYEAGDFDGATDHFKNAVELDETDSMYRTWLGRAYIAKLQTVSFFEKGVLSGRALEQLQKAVKLDPTNVEARITLAGYYLNAPSIAGGSKKKAREQAEEIVKYDEVRGNWIMAGVLIKDEQYDEAIAKLESCIDAQPDNIECRYRLAMLYQQLEQYNETFAEFEEVLLIDPQATAALYQIGRTAVFSKMNLDRGIECLQKYVTLEVKPGYPGYDAAHWRMGMIFEHKGDAASAKAEYETALQLNPDDDKYRDSLNELAKQ
jgi:tetratricopeptide (TPR) repeat protein